MCSFPVVHDKLPIGLLVTKTPLPMQVKPKPHHVLCSHLHKHQYLLSSNLCSIAARLFVGSIHPQRTQRDAEHDRSERTYPCSGNEVDCL